MPDWDWDLILKGAGVVGTMATLSFAVPRLRMARRTSLKTDLEILGLLKGYQPPATDDGKAPASPYDLVAKHIDQKIAILYQSESGTPAQWASKVGSTILAVALAAWTVKINSGEFSWWSVLTGFYAFSFAVFTLVPSRIWATNRARR